MGSRFAEQFPLGTVISLDDTPPSKQRPVRAASPPKVENPAGSRLSKEHPAAVKAEAANVESSAQSLVSKEHTASVKAEAASVAPNQDSLVKLESEEEEEPLFREELPLPEVPEPLQDGAQMVTGHKKKPKKSLAVRRAERAEQDRADRLIQQLNIDFHKVFQPAHHFKLSSGHWADFKLHLARGALDQLGCQLCMDMMTQNNITLPSRDELLDDELGECRRDPAYKADFDRRLQQLKEQEGLAALKRGRRAKVQDAEAVPLHENLYKWLSVRRPGLYTVDPKAPLKLTCTACGVQVNARRSSTVFYVLQHEAYATHQEAVSARSRGEKCTGVPIQAAEVRAASHVQSFASWIANRKPWVGNEVTEACRLQERLPIVQAKACLEKERFLDPASGVPACAACMELANRETFVKKVCQVAYHIDLCRLLQLSMHDQQRTRHTDAMAQSDYVHLLALEREIQSLRSLSHVQLYQHLDRSFLCVPRKMCNQAMLELLETQVLWIPRQEPREPDQQQLVLQEMDYYLGNNLQHNTDAERDLAQLILRGVLRHDTVLKTLVTALVVKAERIHNGSSRLTTSSLPHTSEAQLHEVGFTLATCSNHSGLMKLFGLNAKTVGRVWLEDDELPIVLNPSAAAGEGLGETSQLQRNCHCVLHLLSVHGSRNCIICFDETVWMPNWSLVHLRSGPHYIGGGVAGRIQVPASTTSPSELKLTDLAQETLHCMIKRADTRRLVYDIRCLPRRKADVTWPAVLATTAELWQSCVQANGVPPIGQSFDNHPSQAPFSRMFLGLMDPSEYEHVEFFKQCVLKTGEHTMELYPFATLFWQKVHPIFSVNDPGHVQKDCVRALRVPSRMMYVAGFRVVPSTLLLRGLPLASYAGRDLQCDKEAAFVLASNLVQLDTWDTPGILLFQLLMALSTGMWLGAEAFSPRELFFNTMCGYYLILLTVQEAWQKRGAGWQSQFLHVVTTRNLLYTTIHMTERVRHWPSASLPFRPAKTTEDSCEHHFGRIKSSLQNVSMTLKHALLATQRQHWLQSKQDPEPSKPCGPQSVWSGLSDEEASELSKRALKTTCLFRSVVGVQRPAALVEAELKQWWADVGQALLFQAGGPKAVAEKVAVFLLLILCVVNIYRYV